MHRLQDPQPLCGFRSMSSVSSDDVHDGFDSRPLVDLGSDDGRMAVMVDDETASERLALALDLFEFGFEMMAANLRRRYPDATPQEIERRLDAWLTERPGAEHGDSCGVPVPLTRFR